MQWSIFFLLKATLDLAGCCVDLSCLDMVCTASHIHCALWMESDISSKSSAQVGCPTGIFPMRKPRSREDSCSSMGCMNTLKRGAPSILTF